MFGAVVPCEQKFLFSKQSLESSFGGVWVDDTDDIYAIVMHLAAFLRVQCLCVCVCVCVCVCGLTRRVWSLQMCSVRL